MLHPASAQGRTPLHIAAWRGDEEMVQLLIIHKADLTRVTFAQRTALHEAIAPGHSHVCVSHLLSAVLALPRGPDAPINPPPLDAQRTAARARAGLEGGGGPSTVGHTLRGGTNIGMTMLEDFLPEVENGDADGGVCTTLLLPRSQQGILNAQDEQGRTALMLAAYVGMDDTVKAMLEAGADMHRPDAQGWRAISCAVRGWGEEGKGEWGEDSWPESNPAKESQRWPRSCLWDWTPACSSNQLCFLFGEGGTPLAPRLHPTCQGQVVSHDLLSNST